SDIPREFEYSESEIKILKVIRSRDYVVVYRITTRGKTFALKVYKYKNEAISERGIPKPNIFFESKHDVYTRLSSLNESLLILILKYYRYMRFTKPP
ncbi:hypothetical protein BGZ57DRAFT_777521, partial [Hyaloscypha finlandica]